MLMIFSAFGSLPQHLSCKEGAGDGDDGVAEQGPSSRGRSAYFLMRFDPLSSLEKCTMTRIYYDIPNP